MRGDLDPLVGASTYDPELLFHLAAEADRQAQPQRAVALYERLLGDFPNSELARPARFNVGLLYEKAGDFGRAASSYRQICDAPRPASAEGRRTWLDAHYRLAVCSGELDDWWTSVGVFDRVLALDWIEPFDRLEAMVGRGIAMLHAGDGGAAEVALSGALRFYTEVSRTQHFDDRGLAAEAAFHLGEIASEAYAAVQLELPAELLKSRLEEKCEYLLSAQNRFLRAIRYGDARTAAAAGYKIGWLYESLYDQVLAIEAPPDLDDDQREIYWQEVKSRVRVLVKKAIRIYERTLLVGKSAAEAAPWVGRIEAALSRLKAVYLEGRDEEHVD